MARIARDSSDRWLGDMPSLVDTIAFSGRLLGIILPGMLLVWSQTDFSYLGGRGAWLAIWAMLYEVLKVDDFRVRRTIRRWLRRHGWVRPAPRWRALTIADRYWRKSILGLVPTIALCLAGLWLIYLDLREWAPVGEGGNVVDLVLAIVVFIFVAVETLGFLTHFVIVRLLRPSSS